MNPTEQEIAQIESLKRERQEWLNWADALTGNKHYLASKMRSEIATALAATSSVSQWQPTIKVLSDCQKALIGLPENIMGRDNQDGYFYRDELIAAINR